MYKILVVDNNRAFLDTFAEYLTQANYRVLKAYTLEQARMFMDNERIHLTLLDVRMINDDDPRDKSGLDLAREETYAHILKVLFTSWANLDDALEAVRPRGDRSPAAVDYLIKEQDVAEMVRKIDALLHQHTPPGRDVTFRWAAKNWVSSFAQLAAMLEGDNDTAHLPDRIDEMRELLTTLFRAYASVMFVRCLWAKAGCVAQQVSASQQAQEGSFIAICGTRQAIEDLEQGYQQTGLGVTGCAIHETRLTPHFGAVLVEFTRRDLWSLDTFRAFYYAGTERALVNVIAEFAEQRLRPLGQLGQVIERAVPLVEACGEVLGCDLDLLPSEAFRQHCACLCESAVTRGLASSLLLDAKSLTVQFRASWQPVMYTNPLAFVNDIAHYSSDAFVKTLSIGGMDVDTILVDGEGLCWLTDLRGVRQAPVWWDYVNLEANLRLAFSPELELSDLLDMDKSLLEAPGLRAPGVAADVAPACRKMRSVILAIRSQAAAMAGDDPTPYHIGLFCAMMAALSDIVDVEPYSVEEVKSGVYALILAAMLAERIPQKPDMGRTERSGVLRYDDLTGEVLVGTRPVNLRPAERKLLTYLYVHAGEVCNHTEILRGAYGIAHPSPGDKGLLTTNVGRLREKIESSYGEWRYLITHRGKGYQLILDPD